MTVLQPAIALASSPSSSSELTQDHLRAAKLCRDVYSESVESSPDTYVESADTGAQATVTLEGTKATVCFRGSDSAADWKTNFSLAKVPFLSRKHTNPEVEVHSGFFMAHNSVKAKIYAKLNKMLESGECTSILFAGHSSGVMSAISAFDFQNDKNVPVEVVTFGAPKVGNAAFASDFDRAITCTRIVNDNDGVALAPMFGGYHHVGSNVIHMADPGGDGGVAQLFSKLWSMVRLDAVSDHNIDKYVTNIERCLKKVN
ncbi:EsV-1-185 [Ectocarpus siliculosus]|uniref:EsV-1-185 n=1 Tax=Ectocarpus siliculosus TaxID=2880 RepID=D8LPK4_ECTSI|nr:EsV-1-185 [Ectocarpus siliculosus]|eukprot:CBN80476.1 EsV-1-185 [Ectocarpus siliculosus]